MMAKLKKEIDRQSLAEYFLYGFVPAPATIFEGAKKPVAKLWQLDYSKKLDWSKGKIKREVVRLLKKAVKKSLVGKPPFGVFLSGGIDSGLVAAMMSKFITPAEIQAFTVGFEEKKFDESNYATAIARHLGIKNHFLKTFSPKEALRLTRRLSEVLDEPMADPSLLPTLFAFEWARKKVKVAFLGDGGDESFGGYPKHLAHWFLERTWFGRLLRVSGLSGVLGKWGRLGKLGKFLCYAPYSLYLRNQLWISQFSSQEVEKLIGQKVNFEDLERYHQEFDGQDPLDEGFFLDQKLTLPDLYLVKTEQTSKAAGLKIVCPFLDKELVEFCCQIPFELKLRGWQTKALLREIALDYLPKEVVVRPKLGFGFPLKEWLESNLKPLVNRELLPAKIKKEGFLNHEVVERILDRGNPHQIWNLLVFELWLKRWLKN